MTAIQHDKCYHLTLSLKSKSCGYNPKRLMREVDDLKEYIREAKVRGGWNGDYDIQLPKGAMDDPWYSLKLAVKALIQGSALTDVYIFTDDDVKGTEWVHNIANSIERSTAWKCIGLSSMRIKTTQFILD